MNTKERKLVIPTSERELKDALEGDLIKISFPGDTKTFCSFWTLYGGFSYGEDCFLRQEKTKRKEDADLVVIYRAKRNTIQFDRDLGAVLSNLHMATEFIGPQREEYIPKVEQLKEAGLWAE